MTVKTGWVRKVDNVLGEMPLDYANSLESSVFRAWRRYEDNAEQLVPPALDTSPSARLIREILRIAQTYGWQPAVAAYLDARGLGSLASLTESELEELADRMAGYVEAAQYGCDPFDALPAR